MKRKTRAALLGFAGFFALALSLFLSAGTTPRPRESSKREAKKPPFDSSRIDIGGIGSDEELAGLVSEYRMRFTGLLESPFEVSFGDVLLNRKKDIETLRVKSAGMNGKPVDSEYTGIALGKLLGYGVPKRAASGGTASAREASGGHAPRVSAPRRDAKNVIVYGTDSHAAVIPLKAILQGEVYLVWKADGKYLDPGNDGIVKVLLNGGATSTRVKNPVLFEFAGEFYDKVPRGGGHDDEVLTVVDQRRLFTLSIGRTPEIEKDTWSLRISGLVEVPLTMKYEDLMKMPRSSVYATLETISNPPGGRLIGNAVWTGVSMSALFGLVKPKSGAREVVFRCADGYSTSLTMEELRQTGVLLGNKVNGELLFPEHGFPFRVVAPEKYGMKWAKWVTGMEFVDYDYKGFWEEKGWSDYAGRDRPDKRFE